jgi:hypothetical protein
MKDDCETAKNDPKRNPGNWDCFLVPFEHPEPAPSWEEERKMKISDIIDSVIAELASAETKFPPFNTPHEGYAIILEEMDEVWECIKANHGHEIREEMIQVAAMAIRFIKDCCPEKA